MLKKKIKTKTFQEWLREKEIKDFYNIVLVNIEERLLISEATTKGLIETFSIKELNESIIEPEKIKINTNNVEELNTQFKKHNIVFELSNTDIKAKYDKESDLITVTFKDKTAFNIIESLIGHEMVHREQHLRASGNYFEQSAKYVKELNEMINKLNSLDLSDPEQSKIYRKLYMKYKEMTDIFLFLSPYESMAYAYQFVKEYSHMTPSEIIRNMEKENIKINNKTKKYIGMYWLIKDKIK